MKTLCLNIDGLKIYLRILLALFQEEWLVFPIPIKVSRNKNKKQLFKTLFSKKKISFSLSKELSFITFVTLQIQKVIHILY